MFLFLLLLLLLLLPQIVHMHIHCGHPGRLLTGSCQWRKCDRLLHNHQGLHRLACHQIRHNRQHGHSQDSLAPSDDSKRIRLQHPADRHESAVGQLCHEDWPAQHKAQPQGRPVVNPGLALHGEVKPMLCDAARPSACTSLAAMFPGVGHAAAERCKARIHICEECRFLLYRRFLWRGSWAPSACRQACIAWCVCSPWQPPQSVLVFFFFSWG